MEAKRKPHKQKSHEEEFQKIKQELDDAMNGWKRATADYQNLKRETEVKLQAIGTYTVAKLFKELLPVIDHVSQAMSRVPQDFQALDWVKGLVNIQKQFDEILRTNKIEKITTVGEMFNPMMHEAVGSEKDTTMKDHRILKEAKAGYKMGETVLYPAL